MQNFQIFSVIRPVVSTTSLHICYRKVPTSLLHLSPSYFNFSLSIGTLPRDRVSANIVPVHKKGDRHLSSNYHPISLISIVIKVIWRELYIAYFYKHWKLIISLAISSMDLDINILLLHFCSLLFMTGQVF